MKFYPERWAVVAFNDNTGLGRQAKDLRDVLGLGFHLIKPSERLVDEGNLLDDRQILVDGSISDRDLRDIIDGLDGLIFLESPYSCVQVSDIAYALGKKLVLQPNWEWFPLVRRRDWKKFDLFACPCRYMKSWLDLVGAGPNFVVAPAINLARLPLRNVSGRPEVWFHNAGIVDSNDRKSTRLAIDAFLSSRIDGKLIVRAQKNFYCDQLNSGPSNVELRVQDLPNHADLYSEGEVAIQPSKMEGIGFQIIEALVSGIPVLTTDYPPMNEWVRDPLFLAQTGFGFRFPKKIRISVLQAHLKVPKLSCLTERIKKIAELSIDEYAECVRSARYRVFSHDVVRDTWWRNIEEKL